MQKDQQTTVAVVALSGIFPDALNLKAFWNNLISKKSAFGKMPDGIYHGFPHWVQSDRLEPDKAYSNYACLIRGFDFEPTGFQLNSDQLAALDPLHQWVLTASRESLSGTCLHAYHPDRVKVVLAAIALPTRHSSIFSSTFLFDETLHRGAIPETRLLQQITKAKTLCSRVVSSPAALVSKAFGFGGGSFTLDAACASSLYALKLACDELVSYRADAVVTGGVSGADMLFTQIGFSQLKALSASGCCAPFDQRADGLVVGEGVGIMILKRLEDALRDDDTIYGIIRGIGLSNDLRGNLLAPESAGQLRAMKAAYRQAQWAPEDVDYIECHGAGTPVGDATEIQSLVQLWNGRPWRKGQCGIGSVKSMIGHLLTGAGAAGMIKTLLGLRNKILPPSFHFNQPPAKSPLYDSPFYVQSEPWPWPGKQTDSLRRAAVSAFGFGGINAHVLIEAYDPEQSAPAVGLSLSAKHSHATVPDKKSAPIAIVGIETNLGSLQTFKNFQHAVFSGNSVIEKPSGKRWNTSFDTMAALGVLPPCGGFLDDFDIELGEFRIPPDEIGDILAQQLLMLKVASGAMKDAGLPLREPRENMGAIIGIGFDPQANTFDLRWSLPDLIREWADKKGIQLDPSCLSEWLVKSKELCGPPLTPVRTVGALGGIVASRIAREFQFGGPSFVVSAEEASGLRAVEIGVRLLRDGVVDCMLVGAVDLFCDERNLMSVFTRLPLSKTGQIHPFDARADGSLPGEGAVAFVIKRLDDALVSGDRIYAVINAFGSAGGGGMAPQTPSTTAYAGSLREAIQCAGVSIDTIGLMETHGSGVPAQDDCETQALHSVFSDQDTPSPVALGALKPIIGYTGVVSGIASMAKSALCLYHHLIPPLKGYQTPRSDAWRGNRFHFPNRATYWARNENDPLRTACVAAMTLDGDCMHAVLSEAPEKITLKAAINSSASHQRVPGALKNGLFLFNGDSREAVIQQIDQLECLVKTDFGDHLSHQDPMERLAQCWFRRQNPTNIKVTLSIVADSITQLASCLAKARMAVEHKKTMDLEKNGGYCHFPSFRIHEGGLAFVFPGSGNHYVGMGRTLGAHWPSVLMDMERSTSGLKYQMLGGLYDPWRCDWTAGWESETYRELIKSPLNTIFGQIVFGIQMTSLLKEFKVVPSATIGYSLGEATGLLATGAWQDSARLLERFADSPLFATQLTGRFEAVRDAWRLPDDKKIAWRVAAINKPPHLLKQALESYPHVRCLIINTPDECVIGGLEEQVSSLIDHLQCDAFYLDGVVSVHCDAARPVAEAYRALHAYPTREIMGLRFYSCAWGKSYKPTSEKAADAILSQALNGFDFPKTIRQAHHDGARLFVEIGPHCSCTRMIRRILQGEDAVAVSANVRGEDECFSLLKCLGTLWAAGYPVDLTPLYGSDRLSECEKSSTNRKKISIDISGTKPSFTSPPLLSVLPGKNSMQQAQSLPLSNSSGLVNRDAWITPDTSRLPEPMVELDKMLRELDNNVVAAAKAHKLYLDLSQEITKQFARALTVQNDLLIALAGQTSKDEEHQRPEPLFDNTPSCPPAAAFDRHQCMEFAIGSVGKVLGPRFDIIDTYSARVRLPDEPLMLVDRIISVEGVLCGMSSGRVVTEHDVLPKAWYLDGNRAPVCISVEAGQADLFLSSYLGIDHQVKGQRTYRLLDARIVFHRGLPRPCETIRYDIRIDKFVKQGETYLFFFRFEGVIGNEHFMTMTDGCAGFFTDQEVRQSGGILLNDQDLAAGPCVSGRPFEPMAKTLKTTLDDAQIEALRKGDAGRCFGGVFNGVELPDPLRLPSGRMRLIDRVVALDLNGGRFGKGFIKAEADIHPDDWFLTCHFVDDRVMPGTLMYECCAHTLRVLLLGMGWITDQTDVCYEPVRGVWCGLKCRGPVTPETKHVQYAIEVKEIGAHPEPYVIADAHMYADGRYIVFFKDMSMQMTGVTAPDIDAFWLAHTQKQSSNARPQLPSSREVLFTRDHILEFAVGSPSKAFGAPYSVFDEKRRIARLPGPPYCFMDRIVHIEPDPWVLQAGGWIEAQYDIPDDAWYFVADKSGAMPFCVLLEIALQPCGWLAAFAGSALRSENDLKFRNLGGQAVIKNSVQPRLIDTLTMRTRMTRLSMAADMIIEHFDFEVLAHDRMVYQGDTYFGFFSAKALAQQIGLRDTVYSPTAFDLSSPVAVALKDTAPLFPDDVSPGTRFNCQGLKMPSKALRMIDVIEVCNLEGGPYKLGFIRGSKQIDPGEWFFSAHFHQDPVCPGSLGIESFLQLIKYFSLKKWPHLTATHRFDTLCNQTHHWSYRGQVIPDNKCVTVDAIITQIEDGPEPLIKCNGSLSVDGLTIYSMEGFGFRLKAYK